jgi:hypothetical protein
MPLIVAGEADTGRGLDAKEKRLEQNGAFVIREA